MKRLERRPLILLALAGLLAPGLGAQDEKDPVPEPPVKPRFEELLGGTPGDPRQEMTELFQRVERRMREIGSFLLDASAGDTTQLEGVEESGIEELLEKASPLGRSTGGLADLLSASRARGEEVLEDIDRILEIAAANGGT